MSVLLLSIVSYNPGNVKAADDESEDELKLIERSVTWNKYQKDDNSYMMEIYTGPVNYRDGSENWYPIDITLKNNNGMLYIDTAPYKLEISSDKSGYRIYPDRNINDKYIDFNMPDLNVDYTSECTVDDYSVGWNFDNFAVELIPSNDGVYFYYTLKDETADHTIDMEIVPYNCEIDKNGYISGFDYKIVNIVEDSSEPPMSVIPDYEYDQETNILSITVDGTGLTYPLILDPSLYWYSALYDRFAQSGSSDYDTAHNSTTGSVTTSTQCYVGQKNYWHVASKTHINTIYRSFIYFNTASLPDDAVLDSGNVGIWGYSDYSTTDFSFVIQYNETRAHPTGPPPGTDYNHVYYTGDIGSIHTSGWTSGYPYTVNNTIDLNSIGLGTINKVGYSKYCIRSSRDINYDHPATNTTEYVTYFNGRYAGTSRDPKLTINYTIPETWWDNDWVFRKKIIIDSSYVDESLTNFPVLIKLSSDDDLATDAQSDGDDIAFTNSDHDTQYNHEIELFTSSTGELIAWVNITSISDTTDTEIYMYYGNSGASNQENVEGTWDSDYLAVYHMDDKTTSTVDDSTSNSDDGTKTGANNPQEDDGRIGNGQEFSSDRIDIAVDLQSYDESFTIEIWTYSTHATDEQALIKPADTSFQSMFRAGTILFMGVDHTSTRPTYTINTWYHVTLVGTDVGHFIYKNGTLASEADNTDTVTVTDPDLVIGERPLGGEFWQGMMDEIRISKIVRSDAWINTSYNTMNDTSLFFALASEETKWWDGDWDHRKSITIDNTKVDADLTNFPILVNLSSDADLASDAQSDGDDIAFVHRDIQLNHEIELFDDGTGQLIAWVNVTDLEGDFDTTIHMYYGNSGASNQENVEGTWDSDYLFVSHMDGSESTIYDSTSNGNDGTKDSDTAPEEDVNGKIGKCQDFEKDDSEHIVLDTALDGLSAFTVEIWEKAETITTTSVHVMATMYGSTGNDDMAWRHQTSNSQGFGADVWHSSGKIGGEWTGSGTVATGVWQYYTGVWTGSEVYIYINSTQDAVDETATGTMATHANMKTTIGGLDFAYGYFHDGLLDEIKISNIARSPSWITTSYNTMNDPSTFFTIDSEETS